MTPVFLVGFAISSALGLLLSAVLMYIDAKDQLGSKGRLLGRDYRWERVLALIFDILQIGLLIAGTAGIVAVFRARREGCSWLETGVMCNLQLAVGTNVRKQPFPFSIADSWLCSNQLARILRFFQHPRWTVWLTYIVTITTIPDIIPNLM